MSWMVWLPFCCWWNNRSKQAIDSCMNIPTECTHTNGQNKTFHLHLMLMHLAFLSCPLLLYWYYGTWGNSCTYYPFDERCSIWTIIKKTHYHMPENHSQSEIIFTKDLRFLGICCFYLVAFRILHVLIPWEHCFSNFFGNYTETSISDTSFIRWYMRPTGVL
jgi:hypothetical protein